MLGKLWLAGASVSWEGVQRGARRRRVPLPTYPFERERCWVGGRGSEPVARRARGDEDAQTLAYRRSARVTRVTRPRADIDGAMSAAD